MKPKILIIDNEDSCSFNLKRILKKHNFEVQIERNELLAVKKTQREDFNLCIIETNLLSKNSFMVAKAIKKINNTMPLFFLTRNYSKANILEGYKAGADDFIKKPFDEEVLIIKIKNILRGNKTFHNENFEFHFGQFHLNSKVRLLTFNNEKVVKLTPKENQVLKLLILNVNDFLSRSMALNLIWKKEDYFTARSMDVYIAKLRKHLLADASVSIINIHNSGFKLQIK